MVTVSTGGSRGTGGEGGGGGIRGGQIRGSQNPQTSVYRLNVFNA